MSTVTTLKLATLAAGLVLAFAGAARAETIDFNEFVISAQGAAPVVSGSLTFTTTSDVLGVWTTAPYQSGNVTNAFNGTPYLIDASEFSFQRTDSAAFKLDSFEIALGWYQEVEPLNVTVTYQLAAGGTNVVTPELFLQTFTSVAPSLAVTKVTIGAVGTGYVSLDNIQISAVPEPASAALLGLGLLGVLGVGLRRRG